jgi:hypothetical protein
LIETVKRVEHQTASDHHGAVTVPDALLSHVASEEQELVEPLARLGLYPDQVPVRS